MRATSLFLRIAITTAMFTVLGACVEADDATPSDDGEVVQAVTRDEYCQRLMEAGMDAYNIHRIDLMADPFSVYLSCKDGGQWWGEPQCKNHYAYYGVRSIMG